MDITTFYYIVLGIGYENIRWTITISKIFRELDSQKWIWSIS